MKTISATLSLVVTLVLSSVAFADIVFDGRFYNGGFSRYRALEANGILVKGKSMPDGISAHLEQVSDPAGSGKSVMRATSLKGDKRTSGGFRSELSTVIDPIGSERWYAWSYYLPREWKNIKKEIIIAQVHSIADVGECNTRNPPLAFLAGNQKLKLVNAFDFDKITCPSHRKAVALVDFERRKLISWPLETEKWVSLVLHVKWAADDTGFLELWKDGVLIFQEKNHINTFNDERGVWYKTGIYDWSNNPESISVYSTGVKIGDEKETLQSMSNSLTLDNAR